MYKAVLFDMDGTVLDTLSDLTAAVNHSLKTFGMPERSRAEIRSFLGNGPARLISRAVPQGTEPELEKQVLDYYRPYYESHAQIETGPYPGIMELMHQLKKRGIKLGIISNKQEEAVLPLAQLHFPGLLELAIGLSQRIKSKPDPASVLYAMEQLGLEKSETLYVGDMDIDLNTAKNAGIDCIAVSWGFMDEDKLIDHGAERIAHTAEELLEMIIG